MTPHWCRRYGKSHDGQQPAAFVRVQQFACTLTREQRAAVARRARFYTMPHLRPAGEPDPDDLPF